MRIVVGPDDADGDRFVLALGQTVPGTIARTALPGVATFLPVAGDLMSAVGKRELVAGYHPHDADLVPLWLAAEPVRDLIVLHADLYPAAVLQDLASCARATGATLWLLFDRDRLDRANAVAQYDDVDPMLWQQFRDVWDARRAQSATSGAPDAEEPPLDLKPVWQAEFQRLAKLAEHPRADAYANGFVEAAEWRNERSAAREPMAAKLRALAERFDDPTCRLRAMRGAEVAIRPIGWGLALDLERMAGGEPSIEGTRPADLRLSALRQERQPDRAACVALAALGLQMKEILGLSLESVRDGAAVVVSGDDEIPVAAELRVPLRAQLIARRQTGAATGDRLIGRETAKGPATLVKVILATQGDFVDADVAESLRTRPGRHERWLIDTGIHMTYVPFKERPSITRTAEQSLLFREHLLSALAEPPSIGPCDCSKEHVAPRVADVPEWPRRRRHAPPAASHPWKQPWPGQARRHAE